MFSSDFLQSCIGTALSRGGDYADLFVESGADTLIVFDDGKVKSISTGIVAGVGLRVISGRNYVYLYASDPTEERLRELASAMAQAVAAGKGGTIGALPPSPAEGRKHRVASDPRSAGLGLKVDSLRRADAAARAAGKAITQVTATWWEKNQEVWIATSEGGFVHDLRQRVRLPVTAVASRDDKRETGMADAGKSLGLELLDRYPPETIGKEAARVALVALDADYAPSGKLPVVIDNGFGGVIFHEACGHALEATSVADDASVFCGKLGKQIANEAVTAIDDGTMTNEWGSASYDDEARETRRNVLIKDGVLRAYLVDRLGQAKMGLEANGCGRRESYRFAPTSRMSNTYIAPGPHKLAELIASVDRGIYCAKMGGGSVDPATTDFNFAVREAYLIEGGKIGAPVKGASLIGKGSDILMGIEAVADNLEVGAGMCGSSSGSLPVNVGQPAILVRGLVVGGRA
jgi:TldD protein